MRWLGVLCVVAACGYDMPVRDCAVDTECTYHGAPGVCLEAPTGRRHCAFEMTTCPDLTWGPFAGALSGTCVSAPAANDGGPDAPGNPADAGPDAGCTPDCLAAPVPRWPWNGATTGSIWATDPGLLNKPRRPNLRWDAVEGATSYEVQIDDSCSLPGFASCNFSSPEVDDEVAINSFTLGADLTVSNVPPRGTRYYWRVRACRAAGCSDWSQVRYMDVGRVKNDFNGDGYSDVVVGAPGDDTPASNAGRAYLLFGEASGVSTPLVLVNGTAGETFGKAVGFAGDLNADGFADVVVATETTERVVVVLGNSFQDVTPAATLTAPAASINFGSAVAGGGDVNADGYADIAVGARGSNEAFVYYGAPGSTFSASHDLGLAQSVPGFGSRVAIVGDLNADGWSDLAVAAGTPLAGTAPGTVFVFLGAMSPDATPDGTMEGSSATGNLGEGLSGGDRDGDEFGDLIVGQPLDIDDEGKVYVFRGGPGSMFDGAPDETLMAPKGFLRKAGHSVAGCDVDADALMDVAYGAPSYDVGGQGAVYLSMGTAPTITGVTIAGVVNGGERGRAVSCSDVNGDGVDDLIVGAPGEGASFNDGAIRVFFGTRGTSLDPTVDSGASLSSSERFGEAAQ